MLATLITFLSCPASLVFSQTDAAPKSNDLKLESLIHGHHDSMWRSFNENHAQGLDFEVAVTFESEDTEWQDADIIEMTLHDAISACEQGEINLLQLHSVLPGYTGPADYVWNSLQPCAVGHSVWADIIAYDITAYIGKSEPESYVDFFNIDEFPGKRAIKRSPRALAEWSQLLAGVPQQELYTALSTDDAWNRVEKSLELLEQEVIWVETDLEALRLLDQGQASFALISNQKLARHITERQKSGFPTDHYSAIWSEAIAHMNMLAVPKRRLYSDSKAQRELSEKALDFIRHVMEPYRNLQLSTNSGYAPVTQLHTDLIDDNYRNILPIDRQVDALIWSNDKWWRESGGDLEEKFRHYVNHAYALKTAEY